MLITESYREQQRKLHERPDYGIASHDVVANMIAQLIEKCDVRELLDYGAGKMRLFENLKPLLKRKILLQAYDPAIPEIAEPALPSQLVSCIDVLEHIEPDCIDDVLDDLKRVTGQIGFFTIATGPAEKKLSDGRNAHLIQEGANWWLPKIMERFELRVFNQMEHGFMVIVYGNHDIQRVENGNIHVGSQSRPVILS